MKKFLITLCAICISVFSFAQTETLNWYMDGNVYATTTCESGNDILLPTTPTKRGYTFKGWSEYQPIEYLGSTGTQHIDTGVVPSGKKIGAVVDFQYTNGSLYTAGVIGSNNNDGIDNLQFTVFTGNWRYKINSLAQFGNRYDISRHTVYLNTLQGTKLDNDLITSTQYAINSSNYHPLFLFACSYQGNPEIGGDHYYFIGRIYSCKIYDNDVLIRDFIPVLDKNGTPCMYDKVEGKFYYNAGTGDFIAGPVIWGE